MKVHVKKFSIFLFKASKKFTILGLFLVCKNRHFLDIKFHPGQHCKCKCDVGLHFCQTWWNAKQEFQIYLVTSRNGQKYLRILGESNVVLFRKLFWPTSLFYWSIKKLFANSRLKAKSLRSLEQFIRTVKDQNNFWNRLLSYRFRNLQEKLETFFTWE